MQNNKDRVNSAEASKANQISVLQKIMVKPNAWQLIESPDGVFNLKFTYHNVNGRPQWDLVLTRRGTVKTYATSSAALRDIARIQPEAVVYTYMQPVRN